MITRQPLSLALAAFAIGLVISGLAAFTLERTNQTKAQERIEALGNKLVADATQRFHQYEYGLLGVRGLVAADLEGMTRSKFSAYSKSSDYEAKFPGARGFGVIRRVDSGAEETAFVQLARQDGWPSYAVRQLAPHDGERFLIQYIEPEERNWSSVGLDIASESSQRDAALFAMRTGKATLTGLISLVQATDKPSQAHLLLLPIYRPDQVLSTEEEREMAAVGWAYVPMVMDEVLNDLATLDSEVTLKLIDLGESAPSVFFQSPAIPQVGDGLAH